MKKYSFLLIVIVLCFTACNKENIENPCTSDGLIIQVNSGDNADIVLNYNSNCQIFETTRAYEYNRYLYDSNNRLIKLEKAFSIDPMSCAIIPGASFEEDPRNANISQYSEFEYDDAGNLIKRNNYFVNEGNSQLTSFQIYDYDYYTNSVTQITFYNTQGKIVGFNEYQYDENGNVIKQEYYSNYSEEIKLVEKRTYEFDDKKNPYRIFSVEGTPGVNTNMNNIVKMVTITYYGETEQSNTTLYEYEYNSMGYPSKANQLDYFYGK